MEGRRPGGAALPSPLALAGTAALAAGLVVIMVAAAAMATAVAPVHAESEQQAENQVPPPPYEQVRQGTPPREVLCADNRILVISPDGRPACLWPETAQKLADRGWEMPAGATVDEGGTAGEQAQAARTPEPPDAVAPGAPEPEGSEVGTAPAAVAEPPRSRQTASPLR